MNEKREALYAAIREKFKSGYICDIYDEYLIFEIYDNDSKERLFKADYLIDEAGAVALGEATEVKKVINYEPVADASTLIVSEAARDLPTAQTFVRVSEAAKQTLSRGDGLIKVISAGWNADNSIYYPADVLKRDLATALPKGTKMFANHRAHPHPSRRTEGKIEEIAAVLTADAMWMDNGPDGPGGYAYIQAKESWLPTLGQLKGDIGTSIDLDVIAANGEAEKKRGPIVQKLFNSGLGSVDFVTTPGTDAKIISLQEAAREGTDPSANSSAIPQEETGMTPEEIAALQAENARLAAENRSLQAAQTRATEARKVVIAAPAIAALPGATARRVTESLIASAPATAEGTLDTAAFSAQIELAAQEAAAELVEARGTANPVRGHGASAPAQRSQEAAGEGNGNNGQQGGAVKPLDISSFGI